MSLIPPKHRPQDPASPDWWLMLRKFAKHGTSIASFVPSSRFLARTSCKGIDFDRARCIVELGAGTGPITKELVARARASTRLVVVELDPDFCKRLRAKFPGVDIVEGDACQLDRLLADRGIRQVDHVVSGLPLPSFPANLRDGVLASAARCLAPTGSFRQLSVMPWVYRKLYRGYFEDVRFKLVPLNFPPAGVYVCRGFRSGAAV
ncbi:MAG TPA: methyltransferase domain-containing protein [Fimbriiglobus sp.]|nr:methyltransferase domain-containing protein [Fimbriiglobus sp.]